MSIVYRPGQVVKRKEGTIIKAMTGSKQRRKEQFVLARTGSKQRRKGQLSRHGQDTGQALKREGRDANKGNKQRRKGQMSRPGQATNREGRTCV